MEKAETMPTIAERAKRGVGFHDWKVRAIMADKATQTRRFHKLGDVGDWLYVKEAIHKCNLYGLRGPPDAVVLFSVDNEPVNGMEWPAHWKRYKQPPRYLPRDFARTYIEITAYRGEPLQDISADDVRAEGVGLTLIGPVAAFAEIWDSMYAKKPEKQWAANPTVHVHTFRRVVENEGA